MKTSLVIRSRDEAPRLQLTLASLAGQAGLDELIVVDDGSRDDTAAVLAAAPALPLRVVAHAVPQGRAAASNAGARAATGDLLILLDGDTLAGPGLVAAHVAAHSGAPDAIGRGETWHLRCTRWLSDPEAGTFLPGEAARAAALPPDEREAMRVTRAQIAEDFAAIARRAAAGIYPGAAPRRLHEAEMRALRERPGSATLWAAASGSNLSVRRDRFLAAGGFDPAIDINEHRELAYRLCRAGARMIPVEGARSYHLTHRAGWRDPLEDDRWERRFRAAHPEAPLTALKAFWSSLASPVPAADFFAA